MKTVDFPSLTAVTLLDDITEWVERGGSINVVHPRSGWSLLHFAGEFQDIAALEYLIHLGCDPNQRDVNGQTALHIAVDSEIDASVQTGKPLEYDTTKRLIELGADPSIRDNQGKKVTDWIDGYGEQAKIRFDQVLGRIPRLSDMNPCDESLQRG